MAASQSSGTATATRGDVQTINGITVEKSKRGWIFTGGTWPYRATFKHAGATWNWQEKTWSYKGKVLPDGIAALLEADKEPPAPSPSPQILQADGITAERTELGWRFSGKTRPYTRKWHKAGCRWDRKHKCWTLEGERLPDFFAAMAVLEGHAPAPATPAEPAPEAPKPAPERPAPAPPPTQPLDIIKPSYWEDLLRYLTPGDCRPAIALVGPAGNGKTSAAEAVCAATGHDYLVIDATEYMEPADLVGFRSYDPREGDVWRDGLVTQAFREGKAVILNEFDALNPRAAMCLQSVCQDPGPDKRGRYITTPGGPTDRVFPSGDCPLIVTMNTYGSGATREYVGRNALDAATADRFTIIGTGYENEAAILGARGFDKGNARKLASWAGRMRSRIEGNALRVILSMRTLLRMAQAIERYGVSFDAAVEKEFLGRLDPEVRDLLK